MSGFLPANTSLQLGDNSGNIFHQGNLISNVNGTPLLSSSFPTTSTGTSTCHAHYTNPSTGALKFLNASGSGEGGHEFFASNSLTAPVKTLEINKNGMLLNTSLKNDSGNTNLNFASNDLTLTDNLSQSILNHEAFRFLYNGAINTQINNSPENPNILLTSATNDSQLSASDLKFNGVSLPTRVSTAESEIDILTIKQTNLIYQFSSPAIYADGQPPSTTPTSIINSYAINAWYFKNTVAGQKINWYMPTTSGLKVQDILGLYLRLFNVSTTSNDNSLFLTVYTTPDAGPNYSWYKSRMVYVITATPTINTLYTFFANASGSCPSPSNYASTTLQMTPSTVSNPRGTYGPTENIMFFSIGSNSASAVNSVEVVVQKFGVMTPTGTQEFQFAPLL